MAVKTRKVSLVCYEEPTPQQLSGAIRWAYILHDKDLKVDKETGEATPKKSHYHVYMEFGNPRYLSSIAKEFGLPEAAINRVANVKGTLAYLTHRTQKAIDDGKFLYAPEAVVHSEDLEFDFSVIVDTSEMVDWIRIFDMPTFQSAIKEYKEQGLTLDSLQQFKNFVQTYHTYKVIDRAENGGCDG